MVFCLGSQGPWYITTIIIVVIYKAGNSKECSNYRTIALISHASKILLQILLNRMRKKIEMELPDEQAGFRPGRITADMLVIIQVLIEKVMGIGGQALITFIDYSKAFDSISHVQLFDIMLELAPMDSSVAIDSLHG